jgi:hypothetical protein
LVYFLGQKFQEAWLETTKDLTNLVLPACSFQIKSVYYVCRGRARPKVIPRFEGPEMRPPKHAGGSPTSLWLKTALDLLFPLYITNLVSLFRQLFRLHLRK